MRRSGQNRPHALSAPPRAAERPGQAPDAAARDAGDPGGRHTGGRHVGGAAGARERPPLRCGAACGWTALVGPPRVAARGVPPGVPPGGTSTPPRGTPRAERVQVRLPRLFTVRVMVFSLVLLLAFVLVSPTLHSYLEQQQELAELRAQVAAAKARNDELRDDLGRWDDPAYVAAQARERLSFVLPGEKAFRVLDPEAVPDTPAVDAGPSSTVLDTGATQPWYTTVWESVEIAGTAPAEDLAPTSPTPTGGPTP
ncbi:Septum formation initiator [Cellulomonas fimi]|nr:Septum formation initiator [Cellulomonas fimi]